MIDLVYPEQQAGLAWWPVALVIVALVVLNVVNKRLAPQTHYLLWSFGGSVGLLALGLLDGNTWTDMGLGWAYMLPGLIWGALCIGLVTAVYLLLAIALRQHRNRPCLATRQTRPHADPASRAGRPTTG